MITARTHIHCQAELSLVHSFIVGTIGAERGSHDDGVCILIPLIRDLQCECEVNWVSRMRRRISGSGMHGPNQFH